MAGAHPIDLLSFASRSFGRGAATRKLATLKDVAGLERISARRIRMLQDTLCFMRAYPDNSRVLAAVNRMIARLPDIVHRHTGGDPFHGPLLNSGLRGTSIAYYGSYAVLQHLARMFPGSLTMDWDAIDEIPPRVDAINLAVLPAESRGLEDEYLTLQQWVERCVSSTEETDVEFVLRLFEESRLEARQQMHVFEAAGFPVVYHLVEAGSARCDCILPAKNIHYHTRGLPKERFPVGPRVRSPLRAHGRVSQARGRKILDMSIALLTGRTLEIYPLMYSSDADVTLVDGERGLQVVLSGMLPEFRQPIEADYFFLILKNGVPVAYGPASMFLGCCEMGINLFTEFRGAEIRRIYALLMQALYQLLGGRYFFLTSYGMGELNPEALRSGAFWFYRKLGFRAADPGIEALAREEEAMMRRRPGYRSSLATLRELSHTDAYFDLSGGKRRPLDFEGLGLVVSRMVKEEFGGDRRRAARVCGRRVREALRIKDLDAWTPDEKTALERIAPALALVPDLARWPAPEKRALARAIRAKGGRSEADYLRTLEQAPRLAKALQAAATGRS
jgi:hypothetical protein